MYTTVYNKQTFLSKPKEEQKTKLGKIVLIEPLKMGRKHDFQP